LEISFAGVLKMRHSQYLYNASAYGLAVEVDRPMRHSIPTQCATVLPASGGRGTHRIQDFKFDRFVSFKEAYVEVGGSHDEDHKMHTTYALSVIEGINIADVFTADRVVSRMFIYTPSDDDDRREPSFDITGSHFDNLRIAGHKIEVKLATHVFHEHDTYSKVAKAHQSNKSDPWLVGSKLCHLDDGELTEMENTYHALRGMSGLVKECKKKKQRPADRGSYWFSPANELDLQKQIGLSELQGFGSIICIPKFGVIRLAELVVHHHTRSFTMFRVQMCSSGSGTSDGSGTSGGGTRPTGPG
jgi:hypothetical protein